MRAVIFTWTCGVLVSCGSPSDKEVVTRSKAPLFREFVRKFKKIDLPFIFRESYTGSHKPEDMTKFDRNSSDTLFLSTDYSAETFCYGFISDTTKFFSLIYFFPADHYYPVLVTYSKAGDLISKDGLIASGCGGDCGLRYCSESGIIEKDYSIYCADTLMYDFVCDDNSDSIPNSATTIIYSKRGSISASGKIHMDNVKRIEARQNSQ